MLLVIYLQTGLRCVEYESGCDLMRGSTMEWIKVLRECSMVDKLFRFKLDDGT